MWETQLLNIKSKGQQTEKAGGLAGIAKRRALTGSQYFTPSWVSEAAGALIKRSVSSEKAYTVLDNSMGSGRMFLWVDNPEQYSLYGLDIDDAKVAMVGDAFDSAGYSTDFAACGMEDVRLGHYSVAVINPPFSITLSSPNLTPYKGITTFGKFGANTSALSHEYALQQALDSAKVVFAVLPNSQVKTLAKYQGAKRLAAVFKLPSNCFSQEGVTTVDTSLCIFDSVTRTSVIQGQLSPGDALPDLGLSITPKDELKSPRITRKGMDETKPRITLPVTDNNTVRLYAKSQGMIGMRFSCGRMQALALNAIYRTQLMSTSDHRYPRGVKYAGQGALWMQAHVLSGDVEASLKQSLIEPLQSLGAVVEVDKQLINRLHNMARNEERQSQPFGKWVYQLTTNAPALAKETGPIDIFDFESPIVQKGNAYSVQLGGDTHTLTIEGETIAVPRERAEELFLLPKSTEEGEWAQIHAPISEIYKGEAKRIRNTIKHLGIDAWASWDFQLEDLVELTLKESGVCGYQMGLGKSRMAVGLALLGGKHNMVVVKSRLLNEFIEQMGVLSEEQRAQVKVLRNIDDLDSLAKVNVTTYEFLKSEHKVKRKKHGRRMASVAQMLEHRIHTLICDEGSVVCNRTSLQSKAVWDVRAKKRYLLDGEILTGYARHALPVFQFLAGTDRARVSQPFALHDAYLSDSCINGMEKAIRGVEAFTERHVTITWSTNQFTEELTDGAKREVPRIKNIDDFRELADRFIKRRVHGEPEVVKHVTMPVPKINEPITVDWDFDHLQVFVDTAQNYAQWFREHERQRGMEGKNVNLAAVLQQVNSIVNATNTPFKIGKSYQGKLIHSLTSKMRAAIERMAQYAESKCKPIMFAHSPALLLKLAPELEKKGFKVIVIHGQMTMKARAQLLAQFKADTTGKAMALLSIGCCNDGLNLPEADRVLFYDRDWEARREAQAIARVLRPEQTNEVEVDFLRLPGSIDVYQEQIIDWKQTTCRAGLDYGDDYQDEEFYHHAHFIYEFIESVPNLREMLSQGKLAA